MKKTTVLGFTLWCLTLPLLAQSFEIMGGNRHVFADLQWLKPFDTRYRWTLFSRTRMTVDYDNRANLFSGAYLNYTTRLGIGASLVGKVSQAAGAGVDAGAHIFRSKPTWTLFGLASFSLKKDPEYSWFSIFRFTPAIDSRWKWYVSLELFHLFTTKGHVTSVERVRVGADWRGFQAGLAGNFQQTGSDFTPAENWGGFLRKSF
jgi:hypothetical protein